MAMLGSFGILSRSHAAVSFSFSYIVYNRFVKIVFFLSHDAYPGGQHVGVLPHLFAEPLQEPQACGILFCGEHDTGLGQGEQRLLYGLGIALGIVVMVGESEGCDVLHVSPHIRFHLPRAGDACEQQDMGAGLPQPIWMEHPVSPQLMQSAIAESAEKIAEAAEIKQEEAVTHINESMEDAKYQWDKAAAELLEKADDRAVEKEAKHEERKAEIEDWAENKSIVIDEFLYPK